MHRKNLLHRATRAFAITIGMVAAACAPTATTPVQPVRAGPQLVPMPASMVVAAGAPFSVEKATGIYVEGGPAATAIAEMLAAQIRKSTEFPMLVADAAGAARGGKNFRLPPPPPPPRARRYEPKSNAPPG